MPDLLADRQQRLEAQTSTRSRRIWPSASARRFRPFRVTTSERGIGRAVFEVAGLPELPRRQELDDQLARLHAAGDRHRRRRRAAGAGSCAASAHSTLPSSPTASATRSAPTTPRTSRPVASLGFNVPSLISVFASAPYLHSGAAASLDEVLGNVTHRTAGRPDHRDILDVPLFRRFLVQFLKSIDRDTPPILDVNPPVDACGPQ